AIEADAEAVALEHAADLGKRRQQPECLVAVPEAPAVAGTIADLIRRIRDHQVNARAWHLAHDVAAVAAHDPIGECVDGMHGSEGAEARAVTAGPPAPIIMEPPALVAGD